MTFQQLFEIGSFFEEFIDSDQDTNKEKLMEIYNNIEVEEELEEKIRSINRSIYILAFAEIWCPDCIINVPALQKINDLNPKITFRIVPREGNEAYMDKYKVNGKPKIPTFVIMNETFEEIGIFIESPKVVKDIVSKGNQVEIIVAKRKYRKGEYVKDTIKEITGTIL